jgi:biopolymer transport protein ExbB
MFEGKTLWEVIQMGGFTMYVLIGCSVLSLAILLERFLAFRRKTLDRVSFMAGIRSAIQEGAIDRALKACEAARAPISAVVLAAITRHGSDEKIIGGAAEREIIVETAKLERFTSVVGTIGNVAVYIGLFGTVLGIVRSFHNIAQVGSGGISVVIGGVAEALICTAAGLAVAVPAVVVYNYFMRRVETFVREMELCASEISDLLTERKRT